MSDTFHILILSVGSLLGQNILDALDGRRTKFRVTGIDNSSENPRVFRCDKAYKAPLTQSSGFIEFLRHIIGKEKPDMILPGRDHDVLALAELAYSVPEMQKLIPVGTVEAIRIMNDKGLSYGFAREYNLPFANSIILKYDKLDEARAWARRCGFPLLAKPQEGFGSLGIRIICDETQLEAFLSSNSEKFLLQEILGVEDEYYRLIEKFRIEVDTGVPLFFHMPDENQFAGQTVIRPDGSVGEIFTSRSLMVLGRCERAVRWDDPVFLATTRAYAEAISDCGWRGMFNLQCRRTVNGYIGNEMSGRMTGSTSARGWLGYDEIRQLILEFYKLDIGPDDRYSKDAKGTVYRALTDYFVLENNQQVLNKQGIWKQENRFLNKEEKHIAESVQPVYKGHRKEKKSILITGSTGYCGQSLIQRLSEEALYHINIICRNKNNAQKLFGAKIANYYDQEELLQGSLPLRDVDVLLHFAFARPHYGNGEISKSLEFTSRLFSQAVKHQIQGIINVSSRSVYGIETPPPWKEGAFVAPVSVYGQAKFASELLLQTLLESHPQTMGTSIRLGAVSGGAGGLVDVFVLSKFVKQALSGDPIRIVGGSQEFDILDIRDTADAFSALLKAPPESWKAIYNLSSKSSYNIVSMAQMCVNIASRFNGGIKTPILIEEKVVNLKYGMDSSLFYQDMNWYPKRKLEDTIESLIRYYLSLNGM